jgi:hypothetical protein
MHAWPTLRRKSEPVKYTHTSFVSSLGDGRQITAGNLAPNTGDAVPESDEERDYIGGTCPPSNKEPHQDCP